MKLDLLGDQRSRDHKLGRSRNEGCGWHLQVDKLVCEQKMVSASLQVLMLYLLDSQTPIKSYGSVYVRGERWNFPTRETQCFLARDSGDASLGAAASLRERTKPPSGMVGCEAS